MILAKCNKGEGAVKMNHTSHSIKEVKRLHKYFPHGTRQRDSEGNNQNLKAHYQLYDTTHTETRRENL